MNDFCIYGKYVYSGLLKRFCCHSKDEFYDFLKQAQKTNNGYFVGYVNYELFSSSGEVVAEFAHFEHKKRFKKSRIPNDFSIFKPFFYPQIIKNLDKTSYFRAFERVKNELKKGNSYQVNLTSELEISSRCDDFEIFNELLVRQKSAFACHFKGEYSTAISLSPELFFKLRGKKIIFAPMKGTIKRGANKSEDKALKAFLKSDSKTRSENLMIVDLLRNDMSRVIKTGSLRIKKLMKIIKLKTLFQAISVLEAKFVKADLAAVFEAVYPCGSVTGAPKHKTMKIINELEARKRGIYCGALGVIESNKASFSVPIRTLEKRQNESIYRYGVGSGVVWDSQSSAEYDELVLKTSFLRPKIQFCLFETMLMRRDSVFLLSEHLARLSGSAKALGFNIPYFGVFEEKKSKLSFKDALSVRNSSYFEPLSAFFNPFVLDIKDEFTRLHLMLNKNGELQITQSEIPPIQSNKIIISPKSLNSQNDLIYHKTTLRSEHIVPEGYFDIIYLNEKNELCEGSRSNIVLDIDGELLTPSLECGLLAGTLRGALVKNGAIKEAVLGQNELKNARKIYCLNSLRGAVEVML